MRDSPGLMPDDLDILAGGVEDLQHLLVGHQLKERRKLNAWGQRIDHDRFLGARHLNYAEQGIVGRLAQEFGIDGYEGVRWEAAKSRCQVRSVGDQIHEQSIALRSRAICRKC